MGQIPLPCLRLDNRAVAALLQRIGVIAVGCQQRIVRHGFIRAEHIVCTGNRHAMGVPGAALGHDQVIVVAKMVDARSLGAADAGAAVDLAPLTEQCARLAVYVVLGSYDDFMMEKSRDLVVAGRMADQAASSNEVMTIYNKNNPLKVGDTVYISGRDLTIVGAFSEGMFPDDVTVICPQALFDRLVRAQNYNMIGVLLNDSATEQTVMQIAHLATDEIIVSDVRERNSQEAATYLASRIVVYGFLAIIGLISLFNIVNSISMSVSARTKQYGVMRAIGMDGSQLTRMVAAEAFTYAVSGLIVGCIAGLLLSRMLYARLITRYFGMTWHLPGMTLCLIILFVFAAAALAVHAPAKRIRNMAITETINEL